MKQKVFLGVTALIIFVVGFFSGMEYKTYQVRTALKNTFSGLTNTTTTPSVSDKSANTAIEQAKKEGMVTIEKQIGDEIELATIKLKVNKAEEKQTLSASYGSPKVAREGTKFIVVNMDVTNTTNSKFTLSPDFLLIDNQGREYTTYTESIGAINNYLNYKDLSPSVKETGSFIYEIPSDAASYYLVAAKAGTKDLYKIMLK